MNEIEKLREAARNMAALDIFRHMASDEKANKLLEQLRSLPDGALNAMSKLSGLPDDQADIHLAMMRGEKNIFMEELGNVDGLLKTGDVILMTGTSSSSQALAKGQKAFYSEARSSHVALVHADFICIDAMPQLGASNRIISDVLSNVQVDWRVIRYRELQVEHEEIITRACVFYNAQPYKILPSRKSLKKHSYCSELARKVYSHTGITNSGIPNKIVIKPADFDRLADEQSQWLDVTETVRPAVDFCRKYPELVRVATKLFIDGLKLNRKRFEERTSQLASAQAAAKAGKISREQLLSVTRAIKEIENNLNNTFWDVTRKA